MQMDSFGKQFQRIRSILDEAYDDLYVPSDIIHVIVKYKYESELHSFENKIQEMVTVLESMVDNYESATVACHLNFCIGPCIHDSEIHSIYIDCVQQIQKIYEITKKFKWNPPIIRMVSDSFVTLALQNEIGRVLYSAWVSWWQLFDPEIIDANLVLINPVPRTSI